MDGTDRSDFVVNPTVDLALLARWPPTIFFTASRDGAAWLERKGLLCRTVTIKVRYSDFTTITRSHSQLPPTRNADEIAARAVALLERTEAGHRPVRLLGASVHNLVDPAAHDDRELPLFDG